MKTNLKALRTQKNISQLVLANLIGCSQNLISKTELGNGDPKASILIELSNYFGVSIDYLLGTTEYKYRIKTNITHTPQHNSYYEYFKKLTLLNERDKNLVFSIIDMLKQ